MDALDQLTNMYASSHGSGTFNKPQNPSISKFDDYEGGDILKIYGGHGDDMGFGHGKQINDREYFDDYSGDEQPHFGIEKQRNNYQKATKFINNDNPRPFTGGGRNTRNEGFEDVLDSLKGDGYDSGRFGNPQQMNRPYTGPNNYASGYEGDRRNAGPISVEARSIPDLDRSRASSREDDLRSIQPQFLNRGGVSGLHTGSTNNRGVSTGEDKRRSQYRNDPAPVGGIDVIETPASRRNKTAEPRNANTHKNEKARFIEKSKSGMNFGVPDQDKQFNKPPLHKHVSMMEEDDRLSQFRVKDEPRFGRARNEDDNVSDITSRRRVDQNESFQGNAPIGALDSSNSRRSGRFVQAKTPGFKRNEDSGPTQSKNVFESNKRVAAQPFGAKIDDIKSVESPGKKRAWEKVNEIKKIDSLSPMQKADFERIQRIKDEIKEEQQKRKQIENEHKEQIKLMKQKHQTDIEKIKPPQNTEEERKELIRSLTKKLDREVERIQRQHEANLQTQEFNHKANLEREKILAEQHSEVLKRQLEQQIQIAELVRNVQGSSTKLESILKSNMDINESNLREKQKKVLLLEKEVNEKLTQLLIKQRTYNDLEKKCDGVLKDYEVLRAEKLKLQERDRNEVSNNTERYKNQENKLIQEVTLLKIKVENQKDK